MEVSASRAGPPDEGPQAPGLVPAHPGPTWGLTFGGLAHALRAPLGWAVLPRGGGECALAVRLIP